MIIFTHRGDNRSLPAREGATRFLTVHAPVFLWIAALILAIMLSGVSAFAGEQAGQAKVEQGTSTMPAPARVRTTIRDLLDGSDKVSSPDVTVQGVFKGWNKPCPSSTLLSRSDWVLEDETGCIYVSGYIHPGLSPAHPRDERIVVTGRIVREKGKLLIKATGVAKLPE